ETSPPASCRTAAATEAEVGAAPLPTSRARTRSTSDLSTVPDRGAVEPAGSVATSEESIVVAFGVGCGVLEVGGGVRGEFGEHVLRCSDERSAASRSGQAESASVERGGEPGVRPQDRQHVSADRAADVRQPQAAGGGTAH